jgi:hypothetical protein
MRIKTALLFVALFVYSVPALAAPQFKSYFSGAYFFIDATNSDGREYSCSFSYTFTYMDFGVQKQRTHTGTFGVKANWSGNVQCS